MDIPLRAPRNRTAELQLILRFVAQGYVYWTSDEIPIRKLPGFLKKWEHYRLLADPPARSWRKKTGKANTHIVLEHGFNGVEVSTQTDSTNRSNQNLQWILLGTEGHGGLTDTESQPGVIRDARSADGRITWQDYELIHQQKTYKTKDGRLKSETTWTWRLSPARFQAWEAHVIQATKARDYAALEKSFGILSRLPMFAGIRSQVYKLYAEANKLLKKVNGNPLEKPALPFMTMTKIWK